MHRLGRNKWTATVALGAMFTAQLAAPRYGVAQDSNNDAAFRLNENVGQNGNGAGSHPAPGARLADPLDRSGSTATPIKHVILIIGENRTFDHVFATYQPPRGQTVNNLLSKRSSR